MARDLPIRNGRLTTDLDADGHRILNLSGGSGIVQEQADWGETDSTKVSYIKNKPTIPSAVTVDDEMSGTSTNPVQNKVVMTYVSNQVTGAASALQESIDAKYAKPSGGIPKTDLASAVQTSLGKADTALQAHQELRYAMVDKTAAAVDEWSYSDGVDLSGYVPHTLPSFTQGYGWRIQLWDPVEQDEGGYSYWLYDATSTIDATTLHFVVAEGDGNVPSADTALTATRTTTNVVTLDDRAVNTIAPASGAAFTIAIGALPSGVTDKARDCILVVDCTALSSSDTAPSITWSSHFHPRTDTATDMAIVEVGNDGGNKCVFYISEYEAGEFAVGGWQVTEGGYAPTSGGSGT